MTDTKHMTCPDCERYKASAKNWRHKAYELSGHPLPWEGGETWVGLTDEDLNFWAEELGQGELGKGVLRAVDEYLKEKNT